MAWLTLPHDELVARLRDVLVAGEALTWPMLAGSTPDDIWPTHQVAWKPAVAALVQEGSLTPATLSRWSDVLCHDDLVCATLAVLADEVDPTDATGLFQATLAWVDPQSDTGGFALSLAAGAGQLERVRTLLNQGAPVATASSEVLEAAATGGHAAIVAELLPHEPRASARHRAMCMALAQGDAEVAAGLLPHLLHDPEDDNRLMFVALDGPNPALLGRVVAWAGDTTLAAVVQERIGWGEWAAVNRLAVHASEAQLTQWQAQAELKGVEVPDIVARLKAIRRADQLTTRPAGPSRPRARA